MRRLYQGSCLCPRRFAHGVDFGSAHRIRGIASGAYSVTSHDLKRRTHIQAALRPLPSPLPASSSCPALHTQPALVARPALLPSGAADGLGKEARCTYDICRGFEQRAIVKDDDSCGAMHARILGYLIIYSPSVSAHNELINAIHSCNDDDVSLSALGSMFLDYYICPFKRRTPTDSSRSSICETEEEMQEEMMPVTEIKEAPKNHFEAKRQALMRDGYRCLATGIYDVQAALDPINIDEEIIMAAGGDTHTECAHILPDSLYFDVSANAKRDYSASMLAVLQQFGCNVGTLNGQNTHLLFNVMTMHKLIHDRYNRLELWFEATAIENCYKIQKPRRFLLPRNEQVTFTTPDPVNLPLPSPRLLALHAACAQVANLSGASEYLDRVFQEMEDLEMGVLAQDG